ncbi:hypothetical protein PAESOLCIP111_03843 [Paenibacillus solanacearum]|uniref:Uncharacterized protein n=2 Tax=Paenibacillus solanacearum TaxID=2048548 RepID=A0A916NK48_9BACL|nr:hypothetical protein PAESOLCIP111_03843 [Paenibacillus solanacearum]
MKRGGKPHPNSGVSDMKKRLRTDGDFETALWAQSPVFVRHETMEAFGFIGELQGFNPIYATIGGRWFLRAECEFTVIH